MNEPPRYGVIEATTAGDELSFHEEAVRLQGYTILPSGMTPEVLDELSTALDAVYRRQIDEIGGVERLELIGDLWTARAPLAYDPRFLDLAAHSPMLQLAERLLDGYVLLNQQNGILNPPAQEFQQNAWHRDLPYQHFTSSRPIAVSALFCIDDFTLSNGATNLLVASHRQEALPSDVALSRLATPIAAPRGSFIVFDSMLYHRAGDNRSDASRRAVNHVYSRALVRPQMDFPALLQDRYADEPRLARLLGYHDRPATSVRSWRTARIKLATTSR